MIKYSKLLTPLKRITKIRQGDKMTTVMDIGMIQKDAMREARTHITKK